MVEFSRDIQRKMVSKKDAIGLLFLNFYFTMPLGSSQLRTLQHAMDYKLVYRQELLPGNVTITLPHEKITACDKRENCIGCTSLMQ